MEGAHKKLAVIAKRCPHLLAEARGGQPVGAALYQIPPARDIPAGRRNAAAWIFDQRTRHQIGSPADRFIFLNKFPIAVIHHDKAVRR